MSRGGDQATPRERRVLGRLVQQHAGTSRGVFELGDGTRVEAEGAVGFDTHEAPSLGEKAFVVIDGCGRALRWEPYVGALLRRGRE
jgi:hypothetical protein